MEGTPTPGLNRIKELLRIGAPSFGIFATIPGVQVVQILASAGSMRWSRSMSDYIEQARTDVLCIGTIEHPTAVQNIDEIAATPGLDIAFIGPGDLAMNLGIPGQFDHSKFKEAVARAEAGLLRSGVALGGVARTADQAKQMLDRGYRVLVLGGFDWMLLQQAGRTLLDEVRC